MANGFTYSAAVAEFHGQMAHLNNAGLWTACGAALAYLVGTQGDNKVTVDTIRKDLVAKYKEDKAKTTAHRIAQVGFKLAVRTARKTDKAFRSTLLDSAYQDALSLLVADVKASMGVANLTQLEMHADIGTRKAEKVEKTAAECLIAALDKVHKDGEAFEEKEAESIVDALLRVLSPGQRATILAKVAAMDAATVKAAEQAKAAQAQAEAVKAKAKAARAKDTCEAQATETAIANAAKAARQPRAAVA